VRGSATLAAAPFLVTAIAAAAAFLIALAAATFLASALTLALHAALAATLLALTLHATALAAAILTLALHAALALALTLTLALALTLTLLLAALVLITLVAVAHYCFSDVQAVLPDKGDVASAVPSHAQRVFRTRGRVRCAFSLSDVESESRWHIRGPTTVKDAMRANAGRMCKQGETRADSAAGG
jgi:hypothetical protein